MKKQLIALLGLLFLLGSCSPKGENNKDDGTEVLNIISVNDLHGAILKNEYSKGMATLKHHIDEIENQDDIKNTIVIGNGDMLQGTALSNLGKGEATINIMNEIGFDVLGIGNHEFDWGIDEFLRFFDGDKSNGESTATLVNSNLYYEDTGKLLDHSVPYTVLDLGFIKVGVVSYAPTSIKDSILSKQTRNIEFRSLEDSVSETVEECKKHADIVIANVHEGHKVDDFGINLPIAKADVAAILDGHRHQSYSGHFKILNKSIPVVQTKASLMEDVGYIQLKLKDKKVVSSTAQNIKLGDIEDPTIKQKIDEEYAKYKDVIEEPLCVNEKALEGESRFPEWGVKLINEVVDADVSCINSGAFRNIALPKDATITYGGIYDMMPFDNEVIVFTLTGKELKNFFFGDGVYAFDKKYQDFNSFENDKTYKFACIDYVAYKDKALIKLIDEGKAGPYPLTFRDIIKNEFKEHGKQNIKFNLQNDKVLTSNKQ